MGKAGHLVVMSEFLTRGWNVAIPEVDIGDDIFVVQDDNGTLRRVQVKTSAAVKQAKGYKAQFNVPVKQLENITNVLIHYVFIVRHDNNWSKPVIMRQDDLLAHRQNDKIGSIYKANLNLHFSYLGDKIKCSKINLGNYISDFSDFPLVEE